MLVYDKSGNQKNVSVEVENGENYIKYDNGVLIQWGKITKHITVHRQSNEGLRFFFDDDHQIIMPIPFKDGNFVCEVHCRTNQKVLTVYYSEPQNTRSVLFGVISSSQFSQGVPIDFDYIAIGKWK